MNAYLSFLLLAFLSFSCTRNPEPQKVEQPQVFVAEKDEAVETVLDTVPPSAESSISDLFVQHFGRKYTRAYRELPDYYGGVRVRRYKKYTFYVVGDMEKARDSLELLLKTSYFDMKPCRFSYKHLRIVFDSIRYASPLLEIQNSIRSFSFSEEENCVTVWLEKADSLTIARFKRDILDDDCLVFKQYDPNQPVIAE